MRASVLDRAALGALIVCSLACCDSSTLDGVTIDAAPPPPIDAASGGGGGGGDPDAGAGPDAGNRALDQACTPKITLKVEDTDPARRTIFGDAMGKTPELRMQEIGRQICRVLYRQPSEVRDATHLTLYIRYEPGDVAWKAGDGAEIEVMISTDHLANVRRGNRDVRKEIEGILFHEMTHMYQHDDSDRGGADGGLIEGIADFVRIGAGYAPQGARPDPGGPWNAGYTTTAYFLIWVDKAYPDAVRRLNLSMDERDGQDWSVTSFKDITGKTVDQLWDAYVDSL